jgi:sec-independent protein translocase protein TatB
MFDVGFSELMVIAVVALIVIGPERLPRVARTAGHLFGRLQRYVNDVKADINREIELDELRKFKTEFEQAAHGIEGDLKAEMAKAEASMSGIAAEASLKADIDKADAEIRALMQGDPHASETAPSPPPNEPPAEVADVARTDAPAPKPGA